MQQPGVVSSGSTRLCWICSRPVSPESSQTDEHESTLHRDCHTTRLKLKEAAEQSHELREIVDAPRRGTTMECKRCTSHNLQSFTGELAIHFPGRDGLTQPSCLSSPDSRSALFAVQPTSVFPNSN
jgi:hypothetical protein